MNWLSGSVDRVVGESLIVGVLFEFPSELTFGDGQVLLTMMINLNWWCLAG